MSILIMIFAVCLVYLVIIPIIQKKTKKKNKVAVLIRRLSEFTRLCPTLYLVTVFFSETESVCPLSGAATSCSMYKFK